MHLNKWNADLIKAFRQVKDERRRSSNDVPLRGNLIVIPECLEQSAINVAHESHQGLTKTKSVIR